MKLSTSDSSRRQSDCDFFRNRIGGSTAPCMFRVTMLDPMCGLDIRTKPFGLRTYRYASQLPVSLCGRGRRFRFRATQLMHRKPCRRRSRCRCMRSAAADERRSRSNTSFVILASCVSTIFHLGSFPGLLRVTSVRKGSNVLFKGRS
jgi:hypothetical protein